MLNLSFADRTRDDPYTPLVRVTNSFNGSRALRFDFGFIRSHCANGCIFERDLASLVVTPARETVAGLDVKVNVRPLDEQWRRFSEVIRILKTTRVTAPIAHELIPALLALASAREGRPPCRPFRSPLKLNLSPEAGGVPPRRHRRPPVRPIRQTPRLARHLGNSPRLALTAWLKDRATTARISSGVPFFTLNYHLINLRGCPALCPSLSDPSCLTLNE